MRLKKIKRYQQVAQLLFEGFSAKEIADKLELSIKTVDAYRYQLYQKHNVHSIAQFIQALLKNQKCKGCGQLIVYEVKA